MGGFNCVVAPHNIFFVPRNKMGSFDLLMFLTIVNCIQVRCPVKRCTWDEMGISLEFSGNGTKMKSTNGLEQKTTG